MSRLPTRLSSLRIGWACGAAVVAIAYIFTVFWTVLGPLGGIHTPPLYVLGIVFACPLLALFGPVGIWRRQTVTALFSLGIVAIVGGLVAGGVFTLTTPEAPYAFYWFDYDWTPNVLRFRVLHRERVLERSVHPHRTSVVVCAGAIAMGIYGRLPQEWVNKGQ